MQRFAGVCESRMAVKARARATEAHAPAKLSMGGGADSRNVTDSGGCESGQSVAGASSLAQVHCSPIPQTGNEGEARPTGREERAAGVGASRSDPFPPPRLFLFMPARLRAPVVVSLSQADVYMEADRC